MNLIEERPWGKYEVLLDANDVKVKKITVNPKQRLSYQYHHKRQEQWVVVIGRLSIVLDGNKLIREAKANLEAGDVTKRGYQYNPAPYNINFTLSIQVEVKLTS